MIINDMLKTNDRPKVAPSMEPTLTESAQRALAQRAWDEAVIATALNNGYRITVMCAYPNAPFVATIDTGVALGSSAGDSIIDAMANAVRAFVVPHPPLGGGGLGPE